MMDMMDIVQETGAYLVGPGCELASQGGQTSFSNL